MMGQERNKENMGLNAYYEGFGGVDGCLTSTFVHFHCVQQLM
jgi:hypothetical protein